jgi:hypothetical protein
MYFGTKRKMRWVKVDSPGRAATTNGYSERLDFTSGGVALRESVNGHQEYTLTWNSMTREQARQVTDYAFGIYGSDYIYFVDPVAADQNILNPAWSAPGITAKDGVPLAGNKRPKIVLNGDLSYDYPYEMARYELTEADTSRSFYIPIPPGMTAVIGVHGDTASTLGVKAQPTTAGVAAASATIIPVTSVSTNERFSYAFASTGEQSGLEISLEIGNGFATIAGMIVQVVPSGLVALDGIGYGLAGYGEDPFGGYPVIPSLGGFILGQGTSGCQFEGKPRPVPYHLTDRHDRVGLAIKLTEVEDFA